MKTPLQTQSALIVVMLLSACLAGCTYERVISDDMDQWRAMAKPEQARPDPTMPTYAGSGWGVELAAFSGRDRQAGAARLITYLKDKSNITDAWPYDQGNRTLVLRGRFENAGAAEAQELLYQTRQLSIDEQQPFAKAQLTPYGSAAANAATPSDLQQFAGMAGYTLQVAVFDAAGGPRFREAAEAYCRQLREKNEQAYFYHGPNRSMVTIGLFNDSDLIPQGPVMQYGPRIREIQERFPHNIANGSTIVEKAQGQIIGDQPSVLVHLPRQ